MSLVRAVLDTNIVVSSFLNGAGQEALILGLALSGQFIHVVSPALLSEYDEVLRRPRFSLDPATITRSIQAIQMKADVVIPRKELRVTRDPDDNKVLERALEGGAQFVVTGNIRDFPRTFRGIRILPSRHFLVVLASHVQ